MIEHLIVSGKDVVGVNILEFIRKKYMLDEFEEVRYSQHNKGVPALARIGNIRVRVVLYDNSFWQNMHGRVFNSFDLYGINYKQVGGEVREYLRTRCR
jgi:hypothetical protein